MGMQLRIRWQYVGLAMALLVMLSACSFVVIIPDKALESAIRAEVRKPLSVILTKYDLNKVQKLDASNLNITNLEGIQFCANVTRLNLTDNQVRGISQISGLTNLTHLHLGNNHIMDISAISGLLALEYLDLSGAGNVITDWQHLEANVLGGGLGSENVVKVPRVHTLGSDDNPLPGFKGAFDAMQDARVIVVYE